MSTYLAAETFFPGHLRVDLNLNPHAGLRETPKPAETIIDIAARLAGPGAFCPP